MTGRKERRGFGAIHSVLFGGFAMAEHASRIANGQAYAMPPTIDDPASLEEISALVAPR